MEMMEAQGTPAETLETVVAKLEALEAEVASLRVDRDENRSSRCRNRNWVRSKDPLPWQSWMPKFLEVFEDTGNRSAAARTVGVTTALIYAYKNRCEEFEKLWLEVEKKLERAGNEEDGGAR